MTGIEIPVSAIGRVGMVAMLKRVREHDLGKLVAIRAPAGYVTSLVGSEKPVFAWLALAMGAPAQHNGKPCREIYVADSCLIPTGSMESSAIEAMRRDMTNQEFDEAANELKHMMQATEISEEEFDKFLERAARQMFIERALAMAAAPEVLKEIGFGATRQDPDACRWSGVHGGHEIRIDVFSGWMGEIRGAAFCKTAGEITYDEFFLESEAPRGKITQRILECWEAAFGKQAPTPDCLTLGKVYRDHMTSMKSMNPGMPALHVDGHAFRSLVKGLKDVRRFADQGITVQLSSIDAMLRIEVDGSVYGCPASGLWADGCQVRLADLIAIPPSDLRGSTLSIQFNGVSVMLNRTAIPATMTDAQD